MNSPVFREIPIQFRVMADAAEKAPGDHSGGVRFYRREDEPLRSIPRPTGRGTLWARFEIARYSLRSRTRSTSSTGWPFYGRRGTCITNNPLRRRHGSPFYRSVGSVGGFS